MIPYLPLLLLLLPCGAFPRLLISELQRDPAGAETASPGGASHEFVEITNLGVAPFYLDSLCLTDGVEADTIVPWPSALPDHDDCVTGSLTLLPGHSAVILDRDYPAAIQSAPASRLLIRAGTVLLTVGDAELGNGLAGDDGLVIYKGTRTLIRRVVCAAADSAVAGSDPRAGKIALAEPRGAPEGFSIVPTSFLLDSAVRYGVNTDSLTPGFFELLKNGWFAEWRFGAPDTALRTFACTLACLKAGAPPEGPVGWQVVMQSPARTFIAAEGAFAVEGNSAAAAFVLPRDSLSCFLHLIEGEDHTVWQLDLSRLWLPASPVKINELFPRANAAEPEWFELVNVSHMAINLNGWRFGNSEDTAVLAARDLFLEPGAFLVLTRNAALFSARYPAKNRIAVPPDWHPLNNYSDTLYLWDSKRDRKERVAWRSEWFSGWTSQSLERVSLSNSGVDPASWALAASPTPGQPNECIAWRAGDAPRLEAGPLPFSPNGDGRDDALSIYVDLPAEYSAAIAIYGFSGKKLRSFPVAPTRLIVWDGRADNGSPAPVGPFFVVMEAKSPNGTVVVRKKGVLWR